MEIVTLLVLGTVFGAWGLTALTMAKANANREAAYVEAFAEQQYGNANPFRK